MFISEKFLEHFAIFQESLADSNSDQLGISIDTAPPADDEIEHDTGCRHQSECGGGDDVTSDAATSSNRRRELGANLGDVCYGDDRITINVSGLRFETLQSTLDRFPSTLLGNRLRRDRHYDRLHDEYFFDRNRHCFDAILYYYQSGGRLHRPTSVPFDVFIDELRFYGFGSDTISRCRQEEGFITEAQQPMPENAIQRKVTH